MNRTYRTVYNEILGTWVAVSENTKARGKRSSTKTATAIAVSLVWGGTMLSGVAYAGGGIYVNDNGDSTCAHVTDGGTTGGTTSACDRSTATTQTNHVLFYQSGASAQDSTNISVGGKINV